MEREEAIRKLMGYSHTPEERAALEVLIPELKESEDERIRKWILEKVQGYADSGIPCPDDIQMANKALAYLEKQKESLHIKETRKENADSFTSEQKVPEQCLKCNEYEIGYKAGYTHGCTAGYNKAMKEVDEQKEQSTGHKTYDGKALSRSYDLGYRKGVADAEKEINEESGYTPDESRAFDHGYENGYNDGKDEAKQKPAEWSEEDEKTIDDAYYWLCEYAGSLIQRNHGKSSMLYGIANKLKSLRPPWKPSEEQMKEYGYWYRNFIESGVASPTSKAITVLGELLEQLEKL